MNKNTSLYEFGYNFLGPICSEYFHNLASYIKVKDTDHISFLAREGYLFARIYNELNSLGLISNCRSAYTYASRTFLFRISIDDKASWDLSLKHNFNGSLQKLMLGRFGFTLGQITDIFNETELKNEWDLPKEKEQLKNVFLKHHVALTEAVAPTRRIYVEYLKSIGLNDAKRPLVLDVGYNGTIQKLLSRLLSKATEGLYFITHEEGQYEIGGNNVSIKSVFKNGVKMGEGYTMLDRSLFLECLLTSPDGQFIDIRKNMAKNAFEFSFGRPAYTQRNFHELEVVLNGTVDCVLLSFRNAIRYNADEIEMLYEQYSKKRNLLPRKTWALFDVDDAISGNRNVDPLALFGL